MKKVISVMLVVGTCMLLFPGCSPANTGTTATGLVNKSASNTKSVSSAATVMISLAATQSIIVQPTSTAPTESGSITPGMTSASTPTPTATKAPISTPTPTPLPKVGDIMTFGKYEQDNNLANGKEPITWRVLEVSGGKALLLSDKCIDAKQYNTTQIVSAWATCTLRTWLNADFISVAFNASETSTILLSSINNPDEPGSGTPGGAATYDKVFLLNIQEVESYFSTYASRITLNTAYAKAQGSEEFSPGIGCWWLRTPVDQGGARTIGEDGRWDNSFTSADCFIGIRPAIWMNLE